MSDHESTGVKSPHDADELLEDEHGRTVVHAGDVKQASPGQGVFYLITETHRIVIELDQRGGANALKHVLDSTIPAKEIDDDLSPCDSCGDHHLPEQLVHRHAGYLCPACDDYTPEVDEFTGGDA